MNNSKILEDSISKDAEAGKRDKELAIGKMLYNNELIISAVQRLKKNEDYQRFKELVLDESIRSAQKRIDANMKLLVGDKDGGVMKQIIQDQGMMIAFKVFADLDKIEQIHKVEVTRLLNTQKNGKA